MTAQIPTAPKYHPIDLHCLQIDSSLNFSLYLRRVDGTYRLFRGRDLPFTDRQRQRLLDNRIDVLYVADSDQRNYARYVERHIGPMLRDPAVSLSRKAELLYSVEKGVVQDAFENPRAPDVTPRAAHVASETVDILVKSPDVLHHLIRLMSDDYDTFAHSINVCLFSVSLANSAGVGSKRELDDLATGCLLHDIGKTEIPREILVKSGPLTPHEMEVMRTHVQLGEAILSLDTRFTPTRLLAVSQHHEKLNGSGYPRGLKGDQLHLFGRIVAVADCFDAMTTNRTYQGAMSAFEAIKQLRGPLQEEYDQPLVQTLIGILARSHVGGRRAS